ncbi:PREDICTED: uncharacterized protein LOC109227785 [Nicotiana attenuata]|uniref:uncharacterized protein LOC109227785 n=1 Tax=Nicotiana attenuata TaxID=49451 RepID=UPI00090549F4|nr:PREDICTED: uncharacterized protein LOC109227785 [Nicotiana attenuata]
MRRSRSAKNLLPLDSEIERTLHRVRREVEARTRVERELDIVVQPQPIEMAGNAERAVIEAARPSLANMTQAIVKPEIIGHFELKQYMTNEVLGHTFVDGLDEASKMNLDSACEGSCMAKPYSEIQLLLNNYTANDHNWQGDRDSRKASKQKAAGLIELDDFLAMTADIAKLANQVNRMTMQQTQQMQHVQQMSLYCELCGDNQMSDMCPTNQESIYYVRQQSRGPVNQNAKYGNTYNPNRKNHPNFSWGGNQPNQNHYRPQGNINQPQKPPQQVEENGNDLLKQLLLDNQQLRTDFRNLERQMGQLASAQNTRSVGALPSDIEANPKRPATIESTSEKSKESEKPAGEAVAEQPPPVVQINIPLVDILQEVPKYAKYIKDIVANKRRLTEFKTVALTEECSSRIQSMLPQKLKDPGSFTIQISIGKHAVRRALCDLGASINLMPLSVFKQLGLGEPHPTTVILQLDDHSLAHLEGVIEDVLVQVGSFIFPANFIILDYEPDQKALFILGHPFLATGRAIIDVCEGKMTMRVGDRVEVFNVYKALRLPTHYEELSMISMVESDATSLVPYMRPVDPVE